MTSIPTAYEPSHAPVFLLREPEHGDMTDSHVASFERT